MNNKDQTKTQSYSQQTGIQNQIKLNKIRNENPTGLSEQDQEGPQNLFALRATSTELEQAVPSPNRTFNYNDIAKIETRDQIWRDKIYIK